MKKLVAATCVAVLAVVAYYFWGEYSAYAARTARDAKIEGVRRELFNLAQAQAGDREKVVAFCDRVDDIIRDVATADTRDMWKQIKTNCRVLGY